MALIPEDEICATLVKLHAQNDKRLNRGLAKRKEMIQKLNKGIQPKGYRVEWLKDSAYEIIDVLDEMAREFNNLHQDDKVSTLDLIDILSTALNFLKKG